MTWGGVFKYLPIRKTKGFTLIELLAVIVVLAIIALIAVPIVLNIIEKARRGAAESSARSYIKATETYLLTSELDKSKTALEKNKKYNITKETVISDITYVAINNLVEIKGNKPIGDSDYIVIDEKYNVVEAKLTINGYEILVKNDEIISTVKGKIIEVSSISLNKTSETVIVGDTLKLEVTILPDDASIKNVIWTSNDTSIADVNSSGLVTAKKEGTTKIVATTNNGKTAEFSLTVNGTVLLNVAKVGDYVAYDAGVWNETKVDPTSQGEFGGYKLGTSKSENVQYKPESNYKVSLKGFRVLKIEENKVYLVHAGIPELYYHASGYSSDSVTILNNRAASEYLNSTYALSAHILTYNEAVAIVGNTSNTTNDLRYLGPSGTTNNSAYYWLASSYTTSNLWRTTTGGSFSSGCNYALGIRPVIVLKEGIKTIGKITDVVGNESWSLVAP